MNAAERLYCARCLAIAGLLLLIALLILVANSSSGMWLADLERELAGSLEVATGTMTGN